MNPVRIAWETANKAGKLADEPALFEALTCSAFNAFAVCKCELPKPAYTSLFGLIWVPSFSSRSTIAKKSGFSKYDPPLGEYTVNLSRRTEYGVNAAENNTPPFFNKRKLSLIALILSS